MLKNILTSLMILLGTHCFAQPAEQGVVKKTEDATPGYTLIAPFGGQETFLINLDGDVVHKWKTDRKPSQAAYLLPDGSLLRTAKIPNETFNVRGGPAGGIQKFSWDGKLTWDYVISNERQLSHHDIEPMPNGNVLVVVWEYKSEAEAIAMGRNPENISDGAVWPEAVLEISQTGPTTGEIVWEWHLWDHLIQSHDESKPNFALASERPERIDVNYMDRPIADWIHMNSVDYNPELDQILMCGRTFDEIWIIDHSTSSAEAKSSSGGRRGRGGDLLYRWGNPFAYFSGTPFDQKLYGQHDPHWIPEGRPGAGNILIFNNGSDRDQRAYSTVDELTPPVSESGVYRKEGDAPFGPERLVWRYEDKASLYSQRVSGAQRLPNGNTLICSGETGHVFEVTRSGEVVWDYYNVLGATPSVGTAQSGKALGGVAMFRAARYLPDDPAIQGRTFNVAP